MDEFLWAEKYRPKTVEECILPDRLQKIFQGYVKKEEIPNLMLTGPAGCGKTTVAKAMLEELGLKYPKTYEYNSKEEPFLFQEFFRNKKSGTVQRLGNSSI